LIKVVCLEGRVILYFSFFGLRRPGWNAFGGAPGTP